jgi:hypothetical protein
MQIKMEMSSLMKATHAFYIEREEEGSDDGTWNTLYLEERRNDLACICLSYIAMLHDRGGGQL